MNRWATMSGSPKKGRDWSVRFVQKAPAPALGSSAQPTDAESSSSPLIIELVNRGVTKSKAEELAGGFGAEVIVAKLEVFDWMTAKQDKRVAQSPAGYLVKSIEDDYAAPKGYVSPAERQRREEARQAKERETAKAQRLQQQKTARENAEHEAIKAYWASLSPEQQAGLEATVLAEADEVSRQTYETRRRAGGGDGYLTILRREHIRQILRTRDRIPAEA